MCYSAYNSDGLTSWMKCGDNNKNGCMMTKLRLANRVFYYASCVSSCHEYKNSSFIKNLHPNAIHIQTQCCTKDYCNDDNGNAKMNNTLLDITSRVYGCYSQISDFSLTSITLCNSKLNGIKQNGGCYTSYSTYKHNGVICTKNTAYCVESCNKVNTTPYTTMINDVFTTVTFSCCDDDSKCNNFTNTSPDLCLQDAITTTTQSSTLVQTTEKQTKFSSSPILAFEYMLVIKSYIVFNVFKILIKFY